MTCGDQILLLRGAPHKRLWANQYNGIGGHIEAGEDLLAAARRELNEETSLQPEELWLCGTVLIDTGQNPGIAIFVFRGECTKGENLSQLSPSSEGELAWVPLARVFELPLVEDLPILLPQILETRRTAAPFSARYQYDTDGKLQIQFAA